MNELKSSTDSSLVEKTQALVAQERKLTALVLTYLEEIERRKIHLLRGFPSLFAFCTDFLGYSSDQAMRRISAMRVTRDVPEVREKIEQGALSLTNLSKVQTFLQAEKKAGTPYTSEQKRELLGEVAGMSTRQCETKLATISPEQPKPDRSRVISQTQTQITFTADEELLKALQKIRDLLAHQDPRSSYGELFKKMAKIVIGKLDPENKTNRSVVAPKVTRTPPNPTRYIPASIRTAVCKRDQGRCGYLDAKTGRKCDTSFMLQLDHAIPFALGGANTEKNLRLRCAAHNGLQAVQIFGFTQCGPTQSAHPK